MSAHSATNEDSTVPTSTTDLSCNSVTGVTATFSGVGTIGTLNATVGTIPTLSVTGTATVGTLNATTSTITTLNATTGTIPTLGVSGTATVGTLNATTAAIPTLSVSGTATIGTVASTTENTTTVNTVGLNATGTASITGVLTSNSGIVVNRNSQYTTEQTGHLLLRNATTVAQRLQLVFDNLLSRGDIQTMHYGIGYLQTHINAQGGFVGVGLLSASALALLHVGGSVAIGNSMTLAPQKMLELGCTNWAANQDNGLRVSTRGTVLSNANYIWTELLLKSTAGGAFRSVLTFGQGPSGTLEYLTFTDASVFTVTASGGITLAGGDVAISNTTACSSTTTGALKVAGGLGVVGNVNIGGTLTLAGAYSPATISTAGDITSATNINCGDVNFRMNYSATVPLIQYDTGDYWQYTRSSNSLAFNIASTPVFTMTATNLNLPATTASTTTTTGALTVAGGVGVVGNATIGGHISGGGHVTSTFSAPKFGNSGATGGYTTYNSNGDWDFFTQGTTGIGGFAYAAGGYNWSFTNIMPKDDNTRTCGTSSLRWTAVYAAGGVITTSDRRQKEAIAPTTLGIDFISTLQPVDFAWKTGPRKSLLNHGFISQDVHMLLGDTDGIVELDHKGEAIGLNYSQLIGPLVKAVQELTQMVFKLQADVAILKGDDSTSKKRKVA